MTFHKIYLIFYLYLNLFLSNPVCESVFFGIKLSSSRFAQPDRAAIAISREAQIMCTSTGKNNSQDTTWQVPVGPLITEMFLPKEHSIIQGNIIN